MFAYKIGGEAGPCYKESSVNGFYPCGWDGTESGLVEVADKILIFFWVYALLACKLNVLKESCFGE